MITLPRTCRTFITALALAGAVLHAHPDPRESLEEIEQKLQKHPEDASLHIARATILRGVREYAGAAQALDAAEQLSPGSPDVALGRAMLVRERGDLGKARSLTDALVKAHPRYADGWEFLASLQAKAGDRDGAINSLQKQLAFSDHFHADGFTTCASLLEQRGKPGDKEEAIRVLNQGIAKLGSLTGLHLMAAEIEVSIGRYDAALKHFDILTARFRPRPEWAVKRAEILIRAGRKKEAAAAYDSAVAILDALPSERRASPEVKKFRGAAAASRDKLLAGN